MSEIIEELTGLAANSQLVQYGSRAQVAMLRAAGEIRKLRAQKLVLEAEVYLASIRDPANSPAGSAGAPHD